MKNLCNLNKKCGEITFCTQAGKRVYALNCLYCPQMCLHWDIYINHMEEEHDEDLNFDHVYKVGTNETEHQVNNVVVASQEKSTSLNDKCHPFGDECSTSQKSLENSIKTEKVECSPNLHFYDNINNTQYEQIGIDDNNSELSVNMDENSLTKTQDQNTNFLTIGDLNNFRNDFKENLEKAEMRIRSQINQQPETIKNVLLRVLEELGVINNKNTIKAILKTSIIPKQPFSSITDFLNYESEIQNNEEKYDQLVYEIEQQNANSFQNYVKLIWRKILNDGAAQHMCWKGTDKKTPVRSLTITQALKAACVKKYAAEADLGFEKTCILHFQHAKGRLEKKLNYKSRVKSTI